MMNILRGLGRLTIPAILDRLSGKEAEDARYQGWSAGWAQAIEVAAREADKWANDVQREHGNGGPAAAIRQLRN